MFAKIKNRHRLKKKEIKNILAQIKTKFQGDFFTINSAVEIGDLDGFRVVLVDDEIDFFFVESSVFFTLHGLYKYKPQQNFVVVDMGAVSFIIKGADVMGPGIVDADIDIQKDDFVWICDEKHRKQLAVGIALINGEQMKNKSSGKAIKNIHYVGDKLWSLSEM